jgi:electron transfer flavoprotein beta subunit
VKSLEAFPEKKLIHATQDLEGARAVWEADLPAVITVNLGINAPRSPQLSRKIMAQKKFQLSYWTAEDLDDIDPTKLGLKGSPTVVGKIITVDVEDKQTEWLDGSPEEIAKKLVDRLEEKGFLKEVQ